MLRLWRSLLPFVLLSMRRGGLTRLRAQEGARIDARLMKFVCHRFLVEMLFCGVNAANSIASQLLVENADCTCDCQYRAHGHCVAADLGAAYGTAKSGVGIASMGIMHPDRVMRNTIPVVMAGILGIYGLIVGAILIGKGATICLNDPLVLSYSSSKPRLIIW